jgi:hypothetical protein
MLASRSRVAPYCTTCSSTIKLMGKNQAMGKIRRAIDSWIFPIAENFPNK